MTAIPPLIAVVDDDESVRESLPDLLEHVGYTALAFSSAEDFLASAAAIRAQCLIVDIAMPGMDGLQLQQELVHRRRAIPIVFITAHADETVGPRVIGAGAVACLFKPFSDTALLNAVTTALRAH